MNICVIGAGASGWIVCTILKKLDFIKKITIIGSSKIPTIGVGESTTLNFGASVLEGLDLRKFVQETDATVKYGVYYKNWSKRDYIHYFTNELEEEWENILSLGNKNIETHIHDLRVNKLWKFIQKNQVSLDNKVHEHSWHFDAGKFINFLKKLNLEDDKVCFIDDTIVDCKFASNEIEYIVGETNKTYKADYFVNCCGDNKLNENIFKEEYISLSQYLLTNKAIAYPLTYLDKRNQFHPYTVAKTMSCGWRWITPTQSRIGTGYVFSDNYISVDEATNELIKDIGDPTITPFKVDFDPKYNKKTFKINSCTIGMSNGFLEPLDAPGLSLSIDGVKILTSLLDLKNKNSDKYLSILEKSNNNFVYFQKFWISFILHQYKTCWRNDTQFWIDHKNVKCDFYEEILDIFFKRFSFDKKFYDDLCNLGLDSPSIFPSTAARDIQWESEIKEKPISIELPDTKSIHHLDYIQSFYS